MTNKKKIVLMFAGGVIGGLVGYLYWKWIGCVSGTCMITSKPFNSTLYFAVMGVLVLNMFLPSTGKNKTPVS